MWRLMTRRVSLLVQAGVKKVVRAAQPLAVPLRPGCETNYPGGARMPTRTVIATAALAAVAATAASAPALAEEPTYEQQDVRSRPKDGTPEHVTLDVPADWE